MSHHNEDDMDVDTDTETLDETFEESGNDTEIEENTSSFESDSAIDDWVPLARTRTAPLPGVSLSPKQNEFFFNRFVPPVDTLKPPTPRDPFGDFGNKDTRDHFEPTSPYKPSLAKKFKRGLAQTWQLGKPVRKCSSAHMLSQANTLRSSSFSVNVDRSLDHFPVPSSLPPPTPAPITPTPFSNGGYFNGNGEPIIKKTIKHTRRTDYRAKEGKNALTQSASMIITSPVAEIEQDNNVEVRYVLPTISPCRADISIDTVVELLRGQYKDTVPKFRIIDCRYSFEYDGGHIPNAINIAPHMMNNNDKIKQIFFNDVHDVQDTVLIFHCEFSSERGPKAFQAVRKYDRMTNQHNYPNLFYPQMYVMKGGYKQFYLSYTTMCDGGYIEMNDKRYSKEKKESRALNSSSKRVGASRVECRSLSFSASSSSAPSVRPTAATLRPTLSMSNSAVSPPASNPVSRRSSTSRKLKYNTSSLLLNNENANENESNRMKTERAKSNDSDLIKNEHDNRSENNRSNNKKHSNN